MTQRLFMFAGGNTGEWRVTHVHAVIGETMAAVEKVGILPGGQPSPREASWILRGVTSNDRYVARGEKSRLVAVQPALGRLEATQAALIPIRKTAEWWALTQDERRAIFEEQSAHIQTGLKYLPAVARRLHHCRDLGSDEPFDFLTWFEFAPAHAAAFDALLAELRASPEWRYVDREVDIRMVKNAV